MKLNKVTFTIELGGCKRVAEFDRMSDVMAADDQALGSWLRMLAMGAGAGLMNMSKHDPITGASDELCDKFIEFADTLGVTRQQMVVVCGTLFTHHAMATGVAQERMHLLVQSLWGRWRGRPSDNAIVKTR